MSTSEAVTRGIRVRVRARYSKENSNPAAHHWVFLYTVTIVTVYRNTQWWAAGFEFSFE